MSSSIQPSDNDNVNGFGIHNTAATDDNERPVFITRSPVVTMQPQTLESDNPGSRRPIPVSTIDWRSTDRSQFIPMRGLDFLIGVTSLIIQQTVELGDLMANIESENRYTVKVPGGEQLFMGYEASDALQRACCGSGRGFSFSLIDTTRQEALILKRRLAAASCCFPCRLQVMQVIVPPGEYIGRIEQQWTMSVPFYLIKSVTNDVMYILEGPNMPPCGIPQETEFKLLSADAMTEQGTIVHRWDGRHVNYTMTVNFPLMAGDPKHKALILGAAFLLEYTYFERAKAKTLLRCNFC